MSYPYQIDGTHLEWDDALTAIIGYVQAARDRNDWNRSGVVLSEVTISNSASDQCEAMQGNCLENLDAEV